MSRQRIKPSETKQAQRFAGIHRLDDELAEYQRQDRESMRDALDRLDHNPQDFEEADDDDR